MVRSPNARNTHHSKDADFIKVNSIASTYAPSILHDLKCRISSPASLSSIQGPDITKPGIQVMPAT